LRSEPRWLTPDEIVELNQHGVAATGKPFVLRDAGLPESALAKPQNHWRYGEDDAVSLAVTLLFGIARSHAFEQGNKRTAFEAALIFLFANGYLYNRPDSEEIAQFITDVIMRQKTEADFETAIRPFIEPLPPES